MINNFLEIIFKITFLKMISLIKIYYLNKILIKNLMRLKIKILMIKLEHPLLHKQLFKTGKK